MRKMVFVVMAMAVLLMGCGKEEIKEETTSSKLDPTPHVWVENTQVETIEVEEINVITWDNSPNITYWED